jgi:CheY-like chemotaxis protein
MSNGLAPRTRTHATPVAAAAGTATILVAEDHTDSREALRALLEGFGYRVLTASDGHEAIDLALRDAPDLILMDIMMPDVDGFEAMRRLRRSPALAGVPILAVTAMDGAGTTALEAGATDVIRKPIDFRTLIARVRTLLAQGAV